MNNHSWRSVGKWSGWLALMLLIVSVVSGFAWDIRTSDFVHMLSGGLLNRRLGADLHTYILIPMILTLLLHLTPNINRLPKNRTQKEPQTDCPITKSVMNINALTNETMDLTENRCFDCRHLHHKTGQKMGQDRRIRFRKC